MRKLWPQEAAARGPHRVGVATLELADPHDPSRSLPTDIWYPTAPDAPACDPADHPFAQPHHAERDAQPASGPLPFALFSHGNSGLRRQSTFLTTHLASWGVVVAAPDHSGNTTFEMAALSEPDDLRRAHLDARRNRPRDLAAVLDAVAAGDARWPRVDASRVAAIGHSYGGWTAFKMPRIDERVQAICALAPASEAFVGRRAFESGELPLPESVSSLIIAGLCDVRVELDSSVLPLYERLAAPRCALGIGESDHYHFCDGIELLHTLHERRVDPKQKQATRPYANLLPEANAHRILCGVVTAFLTAFYAGEKDPTSLLGDAALRELDADHIRALPDSASSQHA